MLSTIIIFFIALIVGFGMIARRIWQLRTGKFYMDPSYEVADWTELSVEVVRDTLIEWAKFSAHHVLLFLLKMWVKAVYGIKRLDKYIHEKLTHLLHKNGHLPIAGEPSSFLKDITAHKNTMMAVKRVRKTTKKVEVENNPEIQ